jgi:hypothetical protein
MKEQFTSPSRQNPQQVFLINSLKKAANHAAGAGMIYINLDMRVAPPASLREALRVGRVLKNNQLTGGERHAISGVGR